MNEKKGKKPRMKISRKYKRDIYGGKKAYKHMKSCSFFS